MLSLGPSFGNFDCVVSESDEERDVTLPIEHAYEVLDWWFSAADVNSVECFFEKSVLFFINFSSLCDECFASCFLRPCPFSANNLFLVLRFLL